MYYLTTSSMPVSVGHEQWYLMFQYMQYNSSELLPTGHCCSLCSASYWAHGIYCSSKG